MFDETKIIKISQNNFKYKEAHFHQHPEVVNFLHEALCKIQTELSEAPENSYITKTVDLERNLGKTHCVTLNGDEKVFYAQRTGRQTLTKFVEGVEAPDCSCITVILYKAAPNKYKILTAYVGFEATKEPLDPKIKTEAEFDIAKQFWQNHALIAGSQKIYKNTITTECPWDRFDNRMTINLGKNANNIEEKIQEMRKQSSNQSIEDIKNNPYSQNNNNNNM